MAMCLAGKFNELLVACGVVCSSWSVVNLGASMRDLLCPYGDCTRGSVVAGNRMVARTGLETTCGTERHSSDQKNPETTK